MIGRILALLLTSVTLLGNVINYDFVADKFKLPEEAKVLVVVEGTGGTHCKVTAFEKEEGHFNAKLQVTGYLGRNGMSNYRTEGDGTTPIGIWRMDTPFGQKPAQEGFPSNYIQVDESYVWADDTNALVKDPTREGEKVGTERYEGFYNYVINCGYNKAAYPKKGAALFLHCTYGDYTESSGCVEIPENAMVKIMKLYGKYGDGACFIAQAPKGKVSMLYNAFGVCNGLSPNGDFSK